MIKNSGGAYLTSHKLTTGQDALIAIAGDSTSASNETWPYILAEKLYDSFEGLSVELLMANYTEDVFQGYTSYGFTAVNPTFHLKIVNGSKAGSMLATQIRDFDQLYQIPKPDLFILNSVHNYFSFTQESSFLNEMQFAMDQFNAHWDDVNVLFTVQNKQYAPQSQTFINNQNTRLNALLDWSCKNRYSIVNVANVLDNNPAPMNLLMRPDGVHPTINGQMLWANAVYEILIEKFKGV